MNFVDLLENYLILKEKDKELYYDVKDNIDKYKNFIYDNLAYDIIIKDDFIKLEKIPGIPEDWMGINEFTEIKEYIFFILLMLNLSELKIEFKSLWNEFEERKTKESKFAKAMDSIQPLINHLVSTLENENPNKLTKDQIIQLKYKIKNESEYLWKITEYLIDESVKKGLYS